jgi:hypothetical protein
LEEQVSFLVHHELRDEEELEWETVQGSDKSPIEQKDEEEMGTNSDDYSSESDDYPSEWQEDEQDEEETDACSDEDSDEDSNRQQDDRSGGASDAGHHSTADEGYSAEAQPESDSETLTDTTSSADSEHGLSKRLVGDLDPLLSLSADGSTVAWCYEVSDLKAIMIQVFHIKKRALRIAINPEWRPYEVWKIMLSPDGHKLAIALDIGVRKREVQIRNAVWVADYYGD